MTKWFTFEIGLNEWTVSFVEELEHKDRYCWGLCSAEDCTIELEASLREDPIKLWSVLLHEILHAVAEYTQMTPKLNEKAVRRLEGPLAQILSSIISLPALPEAHTEQPSVPNLSPESDKSTKHRLALPELPSIDNTKQALNPQTHTNHGPNPQFGEGNVDKVEVAAEFRELEDFWYNSLPEE